MCTSNRVDIGDAKAELGRIVRDVQRGKECVITDRGRPVAKVVAVPASELDIDTRVRALEDDGWIERAGPSRPLPPPLPSDGWAQRHLQDDRDS